MKQKEDIHKLIAKKLSEEINEQDLLFLNNWLSKNEENKVLYQKFEELWKHSDSFGKDFNPDISKAIARYKRRIENAVHTKKKRTKIIRLSQLAAAAVVILFFAYFTNSYINSNSLITVISDSTATKQIILPDSSIIYLNKNTEIKYRKSFTKRIVKLEGEAFFEVKKQNGSSFIVETKKINIKVLGTSFNVKAINNKNNTKLSVLTGKVQFNSNKSNKKTIVNPNQQATYNNLSSEISKTELKNNNFLTWKTGVLSFKNNSLKEVLETLNENYDTEFNVSDKQLYDLQLTCEFNNQTINEILEEIEIILPIRINFQDKRVQIEPIE